MTTQRDFEELLTLFEKNNVRYMIVGGYAVAFHGHPRFTKDIDIFFLGSEENIDKVIKSLIDFGFSKTSISHKLLGKKGNIVQFGIVPARVDLLNTLPGITFKKAEQNTLRGPFGETWVNFIGRNDLIKNKKASGRPQDIADAAILKKRRKSSK